MSENFHIMNINVPAGVGAPPLDTQPYMYIATVKTLINTLLEDSKKHLVGRENIFFKLFGHLL